jgi:uncharacterized protein YtpQ (UPF0354 family)
MKNIFLAILLCIFSFNVSAGKVISKKGFTERYVLISKAKVDGLKADIKGSLEIEFTTKDGEKITTFLDNAYKDYLSAPGDLTHVLDTYSASLAETNETIKKSLGIENIFPVIKDHEYIRQITELMKRKKEEGKFPFFYEQLNEVLYILYAFDTPTSIRYMPKEDIAKLGVKVSELKEISKANLKKTIPTVKIQGDPSSVSMIVADGTYEASFLLFDDLWTKERFPVKGEIVVYVPSRDTVLITGSEDIEGLEKVRSIVRNPENKWSHIVAEVGFIRLDNKWEVFKM